MPYTTPVASYSATVNGAYTTLTGVQSISVNRGRQRFQDPFSQSSCVIELIPATSYALPLAVGQFIDVRTSNSASASAFFVGRITDIQRQYDIPYNSVTGNAPGDRITITATGGTGAFGAKSLNNVSYASQLCGTTIFDVGIKSLCNNNIVDPTFIYASAITNFTGSALNLTNELLNTNQLLFDDLDSKRTIGSAPYFFSNFIMVVPLGWGSVTYAFTDNTALGNYNRIEFLSSVANTFDSVQVQPAGLATQEATTASSIDNTLVYDTRSNTTAEALNLANYILATQTQTTAVPYLISTDTKINSVCTDVSKIAVLSGVFPVSSPIGSAVTVAFRGTNVSATIQGINTNFYPDYAQVQLYLSATLGTPFTLDSATNGILDTNRLGYP